MIAARLACWGILLSTGLLAAPLMAAGDPVKGKTVFARCAACHSLAPGKNLIGPSLAGVVNRKAGSVPGFTYSPAMKSFGKVWNAAALDAFLVKPMKTVPGTRMVFAGVPDAADRTNLIAYLQKPAK